ncbi:Amine oxidase [Trichostrongylus colubriformis]|uniref:Amine oxidase n=1 Tax=Trichostrongylus colubriformis TaxID=6319 RepID=A0AAN8FRG5_TRICO
MDNEAFSDSPTHYDVIVIGAGLAGLNAATELLRLKPTLRVLVVEAKERVGGRTLSVSMKAARGTSIHADLGGTWVRRAQPNILKVIEDFGLKTIPQYSNGIKWAQLGKHKWRPLTKSELLKNMRGLSLCEALDLWWNVRKIEKLAEKMSVALYFTVDVTDPFSWCRAAEFNEMSLAQWIRKNVTGRCARDALEIAARTTYGAEPDRINMLYHIIMCKLTGSFNPIKADGSSSDVLRVEGGTEQISKQLAEKLGKDRIILNRAVERLEVDESQGITRVYTYSTGAACEKVLYTCSQVICAVPLNLCSKISFSPPLPYLKQRLFESSMPGSMITFIITFETAFWREEGWSGEVISTGRTTTANEVLPLNCTFDYTSLTGIPAITGYMNEEFTDMDKEDRCNAVVQDLMRVFGERAMLQFLDYREKVWSKESFICGAPGAFMPCGMMDCWLTIREPFLSIHFAGAETASKWIGWMEGAVESGVRSVHEVLHQLGHHDIVSYTILKGSIYDNERKEPLAPSKHYEGKTSHSYRAVFFFSVLCLGILVYSKKYRLSYTARAMKPLENALVKYTTGIEWPHW